MPDAKVLVFSDHDMQKVDDAVKQALAGRGTTATPKGNYHHVDSIMNAFRQGRATPSSRKRAHDDHVRNASAAAHSSSAAAPTAAPIRVLMLNASNFGAGHNIECATHVITLHSMTAAMDHQVVGRAQRWGRTAPLQVIDIRMMGDAR